MKLCSPLYTTTVDELHAAVSLYLILRGNKLFLFALVSENEVLIYKVRESLSFSLSYLNKGYKFCPRQLYSATIQIL